MWSKNLAFLDSPELNYNKLFPRVSISQSLSLFFSFPPLSFLPSFPNFSYHIQVKNPRHLKTVDALNKH